MSLTLLNFMYHYVFNILKFYVLFEEFVCFQWI